MNHNDKQSLELIYEGIFSRLGAKVKAAGSVAQDAFHNTKAAAKGDKQNIINRKEGKGTTSQYHTAETARKLIKSYYFFLKEELQNCKDFLGEDTTYSNIIEQLEELKDTLKETYASLRYGRSDGAMNIRSADEIAAEKSMQEIRKKAGATRSANAKKRQDIEKKRKAKAAALAQKAKAKLKATIKRNPTRKNDENYK